jgi:hypothetical protein
MVAHVQERLHWERVILSIATFVSPSILFVIAAAFCYSSAFIDRRLGALRGRDTVWLIVLMFVPLFLQSVSMFVLFRKGRRDRAVNRFYGLCLITMSVGSTSYCAFWLIYTTKYYSLNVLSFIALTLVVPLVLLVGFVTFLIMRSKIDDLSPKLTEDDIRAHKGSLCIKLKKAADDGMPKTLNKVFTRLGGDERNALKVDDTKINVISAATSDNFENVNLSALKKDLNKIIEDDGFFKSEDIEGMDGLSDELKSFHYYLLSDECKLSRDQKKRQSRLVNRLLLQAAFGPNVIAPFAIKSLRPSGWELFLEDLRTGLTKSPFAALIFFFTIFLSVTYLFGFAFAFEDKAHLENEREPALFMARSHASTSNIDASMSTEEMTLRPWPPQTFYFDRTAPSLSSKSEKFNSAAYDKLFDERYGLEEARKKLKERDNSTPWIPGRVSGGIGFGNLRQVRQNRKDLDKEINANNDLIKESNDNLLQTSRDWMSSKNYEHTIQIVKAIEDEAILGRGVLLELKINSALGKSSAADYPTEAAALQEEEMARRVRYLLLEKFSQNSRRPREIEWFNLLSGDKLPTSPTSNHTEPKSTEPSFEEMLKDGLLTRLKTNNPLLDSELNRIGKLADRVSADDKESLRVRLLGINHIAQGERSVYQQVSGYDKTVQAMALLQESRQIVEAKRLGLQFTDTVTVSIVPLHDPQYIPLGLMDYMYFTIYTITTTGYGDIVPTTTYAKFLCSVANILEVFFLVVFFNSLLSLKRKNEPLPNPE